MPVKQMHSFAITLTASGGLTESHLVTIPKWFVRASDTCCLTVEQHVSNGNHIHGIAEFSCAQPNNLTRRLRNMYTKLEIPWAKNSILVKTISDKTGWFYYMTKHQPADQQPLLVMGYVWGEIQALIHAHVRKLKDKELKGSDVIMNMSTAQNRIVAFARSIGAPITGIDSFSDVIGLMGAAGYHTERLKMKPLYAQVMGILGDPSVLADLTRRELRFEFE